MREAADLVTADQVEAREDAFKVMSLTVDGERHDNVRPARVFPLSHKAPYISFIGDGGQEVALLANPEDLDEESRRTVELVLERNYFAPKIIRIYSITETWGVGHWQVETDSGHASFEVTDREKIRRLPGGGAIIVDADDNRFVVEDVSKLDARSQSLIHSET